jgi:hypothetical protein
MMVCCASRQWTATTFALKQRSPGNVNQIIDFLAMIPCWFAGMLGPYLPGGPCSKSKSGVHGFGLEYSKPIFGLAG